MLLFFPDKIRSLNVRIVSSPPKFKIASFDWSVVVASVEEVWSLVFVKVFVFFFLINFRVPHKKSDCGGDKARLGIDSMPL